MALSPSGGRPTGEGVSLDRARPRAREGIRAVRRLVERDVPLSRYSSLRVGGPADYFARPRSIGEIRALLQFADREGIPWWVLGNGTNVIFPDAGFRGLVIRLGRGFSAKRLEGGVFRVQAGAGLGATLGFLRAQGYRDFDGLVGIPGTVGGALAMNAGIPEFTISQLVERVTVLTDEGELLTLPREGCAFRYRDSLFRRRPWIIVEGEFRLGKAPCFDPQRLLERRRRVQPLGDPSPGCVFKNPSVKDPKALPEPPTAGRLLEGAGLKGVRIGGAMISPKHANFLVNLRGATAADCLRLIDFARERVYKEFGVELELEVAIVSASTSTPCLR